MLIPGLACAVCSADDLQTVQPGQDALYAPGGILIDHAVPDRAWCAQCNPWRYAALGPLGMAAGRQGPRSSFNRGV